MTNAPASVGVATVLEPKPAPINDDDWALIEHWVRIALRRGLSTEDAASYRASCETGKRQLWHIATDGKVSGVAITEVYEHPLAGLTVVIALTGGNMREAMPTVLSTVRDWAKQEGAVRLEATGRMGWLEMLKKFGWRPFQITMTQEIA